MDRISGVIRDTHGNWVIGFRKHIYAFSYVMVELQALETRLQLDLKKQKMSIKMEMDSTE